MSSCNSFYSHFVKNMTVMPNIEIPRVYSIIVCRNEASAWFWGTGMLRIFKLEPSVKIV